MIKYWDYLREYRKLKREILNSVNKVFESGTLLFGEELKKFEKNFCKFNNSKYGIGVGSGTDALFIALKVLDIGKGDEVITVSNTAIPTVAAIKNNGAEVKFVDMWPESVTEIALSYDTASDLEQFDVTWSYNHYEVKVGTTSYT